MKYKIKFEVNLISPNSHTLTVSRKKGTTNLESELSIYDLLKRTNELAQVVANDLTSHGLMVFSAPEIVEIKEWHPKEKRRPRQSESKL